jgi:WD40 repeat protein
MKLFLTLLLLCGVYYAPCSGQPRSFKGNLKWQLTRDKINDFSFTPDDSYILLVSRFNRNLIDFDSNSTYTGEIEVIETKTGKTISRLGVCDGKFGYSLDFPKSGISVSNRLAVSCKNGTAEVWDIKQAKLVNTFHPAVAKEVDYYALSPNGERLVTFEEENFQSNPKAVLWDVNSGKPIKHLFPREGGQFATNASFSQDSRMVAVSYDGNVYLWDADNGELLYKLVDKGLKGFPTRSHNSMVYVMLFSPDGEKLITGSVDKSAKIWNTGNGNLEHTLAGHNSRIEIGALSDDGKMLATVDYNKGIKFWNVETGELVQQIKARSYPYLEALFSRDKQFFFSPTEKGASVWDVKTGKEVWGEAANRAALSSSWNWFLSFDKKEKKLEMFEFSD